MELEGETHVLIIRASDAKHEYQPLQDVIEGDTIHTAGERNLKFIPGAKDVPGKICT